MKTKYPNIEDHNTNQRGTNNKSDGDLVVQLYLPQQQRIIRQKMDIIRHDDTGFENDCRFPIHLKRVKCINHAIPGRNSIKWWIIWCRKLQKNQHQHSDP